MNIDERKYPNWLKKKPRPTQEQLRHNAERLVEIRRQLSDGVISVNRARAMMRGYSVQGIFVDETQPTTPHRQPMTRC